MRTLPVASVKRLHVSQNKTSGARRGHSIQPANGNVLAHPFVQQIARHALQGHASSFLLHSPPTRPASMHTGKPTFPITPSFPASPGSRLRHGSVQPFRPTLHPSPQRSSQLYSRWRPLFARQKKTASQYKYTHTRAHVQPLPPIRQCPHVATGACASQGGRAHGSLSPSNRHAWCIKPSAVCVRTLT